MTPGKINPSNHMVLFQVSGFVTQHSKFLLTRQRDTAEFLSSSSEQKESNAQHGFF